MSQSIIDNSPPVVADGNKADGSNDAQKDKQEAVPRRQSLIRYLLPAMLIGVWMFAITGQNKGLPLQLSSWLTFVALLVTPGYLLGEIVTWRLRLDSIERLALAFPLSIVVLSVPGMVALLQHRTITELAAGWMIASATVAAAWIIVAVVRRQPPARAERWRNDQLFWLALLGIGFVLILPSLTIYKIDGDAYAVGSFTADALAGLPLNATEPLFGTNLGPGVRMAFNQSLPMAYLWSWFSGIDSITLTATASRAMIALWSLLAAYTLGRAAGLTLPGGDNSRRFALLVASVQFLIFVAAPFLRGDNASIFFFERTTADKFLVPVTMAPVVFAFTMRYLGSGRRDTWLAAALATFAVSTIHPLIAAMMALSLGAFAGFHWLLHLRSRRTVLRCLAVGALLALVMAIPIVQLVLSRGEAPLASSYPTTLAGWPVGHKMTPALPYLHMPSLEVYGPLPDLARLEAIEADSTTNPFLIWRFAVNMERRRLILLDLKHYISDPNIIMEPPYLLALLLLPLALWQIRRNLAAQFAISTSLAAVFVMFNPFVTPLIGSLVMPWILWRFVWMLPYALILALVLYRLLYALFGAQLASATSRNRFVPIAATIAVALLVVPSITNTLETMRLRAAFPYYYPTPTAIFERLNELSADGESATVLADQDLSVTLPAYVANASVIAHRVPTTSEIFPADRQVEALQRLIDQENFFRGRYLTQDSMDILTRYAADYVIAASGSNLDVQMRLASDWFEHVEDDQSYSLYAVTDLPTSSSVIAGNSALDERLWQEAESHYESALSSNPSDGLALAGLAEIAYAQGHFDDAVRWLHKASFHTDEPALHYRLGQVYNEMGRSDDSIAEFELAHEAAPHIARYSLALGDACLAAGRIDCARAQFTAAVENGNQPDEVSRLIALGDIWRQRNMFGQALPLYEEAASRWPSVNNQLMLASTYLEAEQFDQATALLNAIQSAHPLSTEAISLAGGVLAAQSETELAVDMYQRAIRLQQVQGRIPTETQLALVQALMDGERLSEAQDELTTVLELEPNNAAAFSLQGDLSLRQHEMEAAMQAYQHAFQLDPSQVRTYIAMTNELRRQGGRQDHILELLESAIKANPDEAMLALAFGDQAERRGEIDAAVGAYQSALDMFERSDLPGTGNQRSDSLSRAYAFTRLAGVSEDKGQLEPAMNYYRAAVAAAADLPWPQVILGDALRRRGDIDGAVQAYEEAIAADAGHLDSYMRLADVYGGLGDGERAEAYRTQALQLAFEESEQKAASRGRYGLGSPSPQVANQFEIAFQSGETLADATQTGDQGTDGDQQVQQLVPPTSLNLGDGNDSTLRLLTQVYRNDSQPDRAIAFYEQLIAAGSDAGWGGAALASYYKGLGDLYLRVDQPGEAAQAYKRAVTLDSWWPQPRLGLARATAELGSTDVALEQLREAVEIAPGYVEAQVALAGALETFGQDAEALKIYETIAQTHAGNANATLAYARALSAHGDQARAEAVYSETLAMNPGNADAHLGLASLLIQQAHYDEARPLLEKAIDIDQQDVNAHLQFGLLEQRSGNFQNALDWFNRATKLENDNPSTNVTLIDMFSRNGYYDPAIVYIKEQLGEQPNDVDLLVKLASTLRTVGRYGEALGTLLQAEQSGVSDARLAAELGELYLAQGRPRAAIAAYQQALKHQPDESAYYLRAGEIYHSQGEYMHAIGLLRSGLNVTTEPAALHAALVELYLDIGETEKAKRTLNEGYARVGDAAEMFLAEGSYRSATENENAARTWYDALLDEHPDEPALHVASGNLALAAGDNDDAETLFAAAIAHSPQVAAYHGLLGAANAAQGQLESAIVAYEQALLLEPTVSNTYVALATLYQEAGRQEDARALYERGMLAAPTDGVFQVAYANYLLDHGEQERASALLAKAGQIAPTADMLVARADLYLAQGQLAEALADLELAVQKEPGAIDAYLALSNLHRRQGDDLLAEQILIALQNRYPALGYERPSGN